MTVEQLIEALRAHPNPRDEVFIAYELDGSANVGMVFGEPVLDVYRAKSVPDARIYDDAIRIVRFGTPLSKKPDAIDVCVLDRVDRSKPEAP